MRDPHIEMAAYGAAERHGFNRDTLRFELDRYEGAGSLSINWEAEHMRKVYRRAIEIADANCRCAA
jgi:hypothetical protein